MIEVFKTNVDCPKKAEFMVSQIQRTFTDYSANFDLSDCDRILRISCLSESVDSENIISLFKACGYSAQVLSDEVPLQSFTWS